MRFRGPLAAALATLVALAPALVAPALATTATPNVSQSTVDGAATAPKVVIVVGAVESTTASYRLKGDQIYNEAIKYTPNVVRIYSPNATWATVKAAAQGASVFIYLGHGYGFPSPYRPVLSPSVQDGMGLNEIGGVGDSDKKYYGESLIANDIRLAKNAVVILTGLCYAAGAGESGDPVPSIPVARQRVDNFASGFIKAGARVVIADTWVSSVVYDIQKLFTTNQSFAQLWAGAPNYHPTEKSFIPVRNPQFDARIDPDSGFYRSFVGAMGLMTSDVIAGAAVAATSAATTSADSVAPELWSVDGKRALTPNFDGDADRLNLLARYSESVTWTAELKNANGDVVRTQTGTGHQAALSWDLKVSGALGPDGDYTWNLHATDAAGNAGADASGPFTITAKPTPGTGVLSFGPTTPTITTSGTIDYAITFASPVTGLSAGDFTRTGSSPGCVVNAPVGSAAGYTITLTSCTTGSVGLYLNAGTVTDTTPQVGPAGPIGAPTVVVDATAPKATTPRAGLRTGLALEGTSTSQRLLVSVSWGGTDSGSGIASYDVGRSYDGGAYTTIASATTATSINWTMTPGHTYRFQVRARDKAGNVGAWVATSTWYPALIQDSSSSLVYTGSWTTAANASNSGGSARSAPAAGASVSYTFSGRAVAWVTTFRSNAGAVQVWVDGVLAGTVDTYADSMGYRRIVFSKAWSSYASHTIKLVNLATAGRPVGTFDAFEVVR